MGDLKPEKNFKSSMPLVLLKREWKRIEKWTDHDKDDAEVARRREYVEYLNATSRAMTKDWPNSLENVNKRNEELRQSRLAAAEQSNNRFYKRYVKRKHQEQERLMFSARDTVFKNKDAPKLLLSAVIETMIQKERIEQIKFIEEQKRLEAEQKRRDANDVKQRAKEWHETSTLHHQRRREVNKLHQKEIVEQAKEVAERKRNEYQTELNQQKIDNIKAKEQIEAIKKFEDNFRAAEKARIWSGVQRARREDEQRRARREAREREDDRLAQVLLRSRARVEAKRKQTEKDLKEERLRVLEAISQKLETGESAREARDHEILKKAVAEKEAIAEARRLAEAEKQERSQQERVEARQEFLRDEAQRLHELDTIRQWEIMNRFKNGEVSDDYQEQARQEKQRKIKQYREDILKLWKEREDREARELAEQRHFYGELALKKIRDADNKLLTHAAALLAEARAHARPERALRRARDRYCKLHRLYPMPDLPRSVQGHFPLYAPRDLCRPDPGYAEPAPPPSDRNPRADAAAPAAGQSAMGSQEPGPSKPDERPQPPADYKRSGRANGMQRRPSQKDIQLPPIKIVPCKTESCGCDLKQ